MKLINKPPMPRTGAKDDDREEMHGDGLIAAARSRERARCAAILASGAAMKNPELAASLAFDTSMSRKEALALLKGAPSAKQGYDFSHLADHGRAIQQAVNNHKEEK